MKTPVVLFAFNRPALLRRVLDRVVAARPRTLIAFADGPRVGNPDDTTRCSEVRQILESVRISGEVHRRFATSNRGSGKAIAEGLSEVFATYESAIILEDDLLPDPTFFPYCEELLARYRDDSHIGMISGCNFHFGRRHGPHSYFFSACVGTWGWATWRRSWREVDFEMRSWPELRCAGLLEELWPRQEAANYWRDRFDETYRAPNDYWDYQWAFSMWRRRALETYPNRNLISHIGCGPDASHLTAPVANLCDLPTEPMRFPMSHPRAVVRDHAADLLEFHSIFMPLSGLTGSDQPLDSAQNPPAETQ